MLRRILFFQWGMRERDIELTEYAGATQLTPFVTKKVLPVPGRYPGGRQNHPISGERYLARWKSENGQD